jgi:hypothetical protein
MGANANANQANLALARQTNKKWLPLLSKSTVQF